ncbi:unnamed protein product [Protopolystoma xenopodis]|uniref:Uncharacterized protein n=1 Tax=Protopolystoma xenopodis TaxID=117903 RepID=A0A448WR87_9PLAT|nr:unnamed protein product [Protopolystoma xenopodis]
MQQASQLLPYGHRAGLVPSTLTTSSYPGPTGKVGHLLGLPSSVSPNASNPASGCLTSHVSSGTSTSTPKPTNLTSTSGPSSPCQPCPGSSLSAAAVPSPSTFPLADRGPLAPAVGPSLALRLHHSHHQQPGQSALSAHTCPHFAAHLCSAQLPGASTLPLAHSGPNYLTNHTLQLAPGPGQPGPSTDHACPPTGASCGPGCECSCSSGPAGLVGATPSPILPSTCYSSLGLLYPGTLSRHTVTCGAGCPAPVANQPPSIRLDDASLCDATMPAGRLASHPADMEAADEVGTMRRRHSGNHIRRTTPSSSANTAPTMAPPTNNTSSASLATAESNGESSARTQPSSPPPLPPPLPPRSMARTKSASQGLNTPRCQPAPLPSVQSIHPSVPGSMTISLSSTGLAASHGGGGQAYPLPPAVATKPSLAREMAKCVVWCVMLHSFFFPPHPPSFPPFLPPPPPLRLRLFPPLFRRQIEIAPAYAATGSQLSSKPIRPLVHRPC